MLDGAVASGKGRWAESSYACTKAFLYGKKLSTPYRAVAAKSCSVKGQRKARAEAVLSQASQGVRFVMLHLEYRQAFLFGYAPSGRRRVHIGVEVNGDCLDILREKRWERVGNQIHMLDGFGGLQVAYVGRDHDLVSIGDGKRILDFGSHCEHGSP